MALRNDVLNAWAMTVVLWGAWRCLRRRHPAVPAGPGGLRLRLLEAVNYLEHYGLVRQQLPNGRYERVDPRHSWNNNNIVTNLFLYHLQRHSDHHANPTRRYQALRHFEESPQLPSGYATMIVLRYFPPLWRRVMDQRVLAHYGGDVTPREHPSAEAGEGARPVRRATTRPRRPRFAGWPVPVPGLRLRLRRGEGEPREGFPAGTPCREVPDDWCCPDCGVREKVDFLASTPTTPPVRLATRRRPAPCCTTRS